MCIHNIFEKYTLSAVAQLCDMMRVTGQHQLGNSCHTVTPGTACKNLVPDILPIQCLAKIRYTAPRIDQNRIGLMFHGGQPELFPGLNTPTVPFEFARRVSQT